ncbi:hypothetical protein BH10PSE19_BH10PSE19_10120 [soil metagenome]
MSIILFRCFCLMLLTLILSACGMNKFSIIKPRDKAYLASHTGPGIAVPPDLLTPGDRDLFFVPEGKKGAIPASLVPPGSILQRTGKT